MYKSSIIRITDDEYGERSVSVSLDGDESELIFIDHTAGEMSVSKHLEAIHKLRRQVRGRGLPNVYAST